MSGRAPFISKINPWLAQPLAEAAKDAKVRETLNQFAERVIYGRQAILVSWIVFGLGVAMMVTSIFGWVMILPLKTIEDHIWVADASTGIIAKPLSIEDAPKKFGAATEEHFIHQYMLAMERWTPDIDREMDHLAKIMSSPALQAQINDRRQRPDSNAVAIGSAGHVEIENVHYFPMFQDKETDTRRYLVRFIRTVWRGPNKEESEPWTATIDFQWHPERSMTPADRDDNPGGFVAIAYTADSDNKSKRRQ